MKKLLATIILGLLIFPNSVLASISFDTADGASQNSTSSITLSFTVASGSDRILVCSSYCGSGGSDLTTAFTYNGDAMTKITDVSHLSIWTLCMYYIVAPDTGTHNVVHTLSASQNMRISCASYTGVDQSTTIGDIDTANAIDSDVTTTITTTNDNAWAVTGAYGSSGINGVTQNITSRDNQGAVAIGDNNADITPPGDLTQEWDIVGVELEIAFEMIPATAAEAVVRKRDQSLSSIY